MYIGGTVYPWRYNYGENSFCRSLIPASLPISWNTYIDHSVLVTFIMKITSCDLLLPSKTLTSFFMDNLQTGLTPLHIAAWKGHTAVVQKLLGLGCNPAAVAHSGKTALQLASEEEHRETVTVLQAAAAKVSGPPAPGVKDPAPPSTLSLTLVSIHFAVSLINVACMQTKTFDFKTRLTK